MSMLSDKTLSLDKIVEAVQADDNLGLCVKCGGVEPDARGYECDDCGEPTVYGAEELLLQYHPLSDR